ncbi:MAG: hypothetical protein ACRCYY_03975 [Trueperaceae bacterium]
MRRRIYKLQTKFTLLGMDGADWGVIIGTFAFSINFFQSTLGSRAAIFLSILCTALNYFIWHLIKDRVPEKFSEHLFRWLAEPEVYKVVADTKNVPLVVDLEEVRRSRAIKQKIMKQAKTQPRQVQATKVQATKVQVVRIQGTKAQAAKVQTAKAQPQQKQAQKYQGKFRGI